MTKHILHMLFTGKHASPFDVNMAADAGYDTIVPYTDVVADDVSALVQDCIFSRPPGSFSTTGMFFGGRDVNLATDMLNNAAATMFTPFEISLFADPNGAFTTSGALVALTQKHLSASGSALENKRVIIFGGGPVGVCTAVLVARLGAQPVLARLTAPSAQKRQALDAFLERYEVSAEHADAQSDEHKRELLAQADVIISTAKAGIEVLSPVLLENCRAKVAVDVNAVAPAGIAGVGVNDNGVEMDTVPGCLAIGALAIGNIKYKTQQGMLQAMNHTDKPLVLDFINAYGFAAMLVSGKST